MARDTMLGKDRLVQMNKANRNATERKRASDNHKRCESFGPNLINKQIRQNRISNNHSNTVRFASKEFKRRKVFCPQFIHSMNLRNANGKSSQLADFFAEIVPLFWDRNMLIETVENKIENGKFTSGKS